MFHSFFVVVTERKVVGSFNFQLPQYKRGIIVVDTEVVYDTGGSLCLG